MADTTCKTCAHRSSTENFDLLCLAKGRVITEGEEWTDETIESCDYYDNEDEDL